MILDGRRKWDGHEDEILVLALTPGIPFEWIIQVTNAGSVRKAQLKRMIAAATPSDMEKAKANAASITESDAYAMLKIIRPDFHGAVPLYAQLWLKASPKTDAAIAKELGLHKARIAHWRHKINFDPLTGERL
jgi:hypothetical protein